MQVLQVVHGLSDGGARQLLELRETDAGQDTAQALHIQAREAVESGKRLGLREASEETGGLEHNGQHA